MAAVSWIAGLEGRSADPDGEGARGGLAMPSDGPHREPLLEGSMPDHQAGMDRALGGLAGLLPLLVFLLAATPGFAATITIDYRFDQSGFFDPTHATGLLARTRMQQAAGIFSGLLLDPLDAITPGGRSHGVTDRWTAFFTDPATGGNAATADLALAADEILVFVGARDLGGSVLGQGGFGGWSASGSPSFLTSLDGRGQPGSGLTDFGPWGGSISFDAVGTRWYFGAAADVARGTTDFLSVALHELAHVLGVGTAGSWSAQVGAAPACASGSGFFGAHTMAVSGGPVCLDAGAAHFEEGTRAGGHEAALDPTLATGSRKLLTPLDLAALADVGWQLSVPEPPLGLMLLAGWGLLCGQRRRHLAS